MITLHVIEDNEDIRFKIERLNTATEREKEFVNQLLALCSDNYEIDRSQTKIELVEAKNEKT